jgi:hypothetical protein
LTDNRTCLPQCSIAIVTVPSMVDPLALIGMDKELIDYIIRYCTNYFWPTEAIALRRVLNLQNPNPDLSFVDDQSKVERLYGLESKRVQALVNVGKDALCEKVALRIYQKHKAKIINLCPRCGRLARPLGKAMPLLFIELAIRETNKRQHRSHANWAPAQ